MQEKKFTDQEVIGRLDSRYYNVSNLREITIPPPPRKGSNPPVRKIITELHPKEWDLTKTPCFYGGNAQGGPSGDFGGDSVIEGYYTDYKVADRFSTDFKYKMFDDSRC